MEPSPGFFRPDFFSKLGKIKDGKLSQGFCKVKHGEQWNTDLFGDSRGNLDVSVCKGIRLNSEI